MHQLRISLPEALRQALLRKPMGKTPTWAIWKKGTWLFRVMFGDAILHQLGGELVHTPWKKKNFEVKEGIPTSNVTSFWARKFPMFSMVNLGLPGFFCVCSLDFFVLSFGVRQPQSLGWPPKIGATGKLTIIAGFCEKKMKVVYLRKTNSKQQPHLNWTIPKGISSSNHSFSGVFAVSPREFNCFFFL